MARFTILITCNLNSTGVNIGTPSLANRQYDWSPVSGLDNSTISQPYAFPAITTIYTLNVINTVNGCQSSDDVTVSVNNSTPSVNAGTPFTISCISNPTGGSIGEVSEPGYIYSWSPSEGLSDPAISSPFANPSTTTIYTVIKTNLTTGCAVSANITVTVDNQQPVASLLNNTGISELTCAVQSI